MPTKRVTKTAEVRRAELLDAARRLFVAEGFMEVSVSRIVAEVGVAQGTFYYHFPSKEAALEAMLDAYAADLSAAAAPISSDATLDPRRALEALVRLELTFDGERARELAGLRGADAHTRLFAKALGQLAPHYRTVVERGVARGVFRTPVPDLVAEAFVLHGHFLFDRDVLGWPDAEYERRLGAFAGLAALMVGQPPDTFDFGAKPPRDGAGSARPPRRPREKP